MDFITENEEVICDHLKQGARHKNGADEFNVWRRRPFRMQYIFNSFRPMAPRLVTNEIDALVAFKRPLPMHSCQHVHAILRASAIDVQPARTSPRNHLVSDWYRPNVCTVPPYTRILAFTVSIRHPKSTTKPIAVSYANPLWTYWAVSREFLYLELFDVLLKPCNVWSKASHCRLCKTPKEILDKIANLPETRHRVRTKGLSALWNRNFILPRYSQYLTISFSPLIRMYWRLIDNYSHQLMIYMITYSHVNMYIFTNSSLSPKSACYSYLNLIVNEFYLIFRLHYFT